MREWVVGCIGGGGEGGGGGGVSLCVCRGKRWEKRAVPFREMMSGRDQGERPGE